MNQFQFDMILKIIEQGAPVLYKELATALNNLAVERNNFEQENAELKAKLESLNGDNKEKKSDGPEVEVVTKK